MSIAPKENASEILGLLYVVGVCPKKEKKKKLYSKFFVSDLLDVNRVP